MSLCDPTARVPLFRPTHPSVLVTVRVRHNSTRLPHKYKEALWDGTVLEWCYSRALASGYPTTVITPDKEVADFCAERSLSVTLFSPPSRNVLAELENAAQDFDYVVEVTGDCPFIDPDDIEFGVWQSRGLGVPVEVTGPRGFRLRAVPSQCIPLIPRNAVSREHGFFASPNLFGLEPPNYVTSIYNFSVDTQQDLRRCAAIARWVPRFTPRPVIVHFWNSFQEGKERL